MKLPVFSLPANDANTYTEASFTSGLFVLYIYPKGDTSGCTQESKDFQEMLSEFQKLKVQVFGLSKDSIKSHEKFAAKYDLTFPLLSDEETDLLQKLDAWKEKSMYGRKYMGAERSTFVIKDGEIIREWRKVKVPEHVQEVLDYLKSI